MKNIIVLLFIFGIFSFGNNSRAQCTPSYSCPQGSCSSVSDGCGGSVNCAQVQPCPGNSGCSSFGGPINGVYCGGANCECKFPQPQLASDKTQYAMGDSPTFAISQGEPFKSTTWNFYKNGAWQNVFQQFNGATPDSNGNLTMFGNRSWSLADTGHWNAVETESTELGQVQSNTLAFVVGTPVAAPAMPPAFVGVMGLFLAAAGTLLIAKRP